MPMVQDPGTINSVTTTGSPLRQSHVVLSRLCQSRVVLFWVWLLRLGLNPSANLPLQPQLLPQLATAAGIPRFLQLSWAAVVTPGRCGPVVWRQSSPSSYAGSITRGVAPQLHFRWKSIPSPWLKTKHGHSYLTYL